MPPPLDISHHEHSLTDPDAVLDWVLANVAWDERMRARRTASFGVPYNYAGQHYDAVPMPQQIARVAECAGAHAGHSFNNCLANLYETGDNTMGFHQDSYDGLVADSTVAIFSLGAARRLVFRSLDREHETEVVLGHGSLLLMTAVTQRGWVHAVPRDPGAGSRVSLTFRLFEPSAAQE